jgi:hypothetical protein
MLRQCFLLERGEIAVSRWGSVPVPFNRFWTWIDPVSHLFVSAR